MAGKTRHVADGGGYDLINGGITDDLPEIISSLRAKRADHLDAVSMLDQAIKALTNLTSPTLSVTDGAVDSAANPQDRRKGAAKSVLQACLDLANEGPRDWSAEEIVTEYANRGTPLAVQDPRNSVFSALSRAAKKGLLLRVAHGKYVAAQFAPVPQFDEKAPPRREADDDVAALPEEDAV